MPDRARSRRRVAGPRDRYVRLGLAKREIRVVPYDRRWAREFRNVRTRLRLVLPSARIEHVGSTAVPGCDAKPVAIAYSPYAGAFYVANNGSANVSEISTSTWKVTTNLALPAGAGPSNLIYDSASHDVFVADWATNQVTAISSSNIVTNVAVHTHPLGLGIDPNSGDVYITDQGGAYVDVLSQTGGVVGSVGVGTGPVAVACSGSYCYVSNAGSGTVSVLSGTTLSATLTAGTSPGALVYDPADSEVYVTDNGSAEVTAIDSSNTVVATLNVGTGPSAIAFDNATGLVYVANYGSDNVSSIANPGTGDVVVGETPVGSGPVAIVSAALAGSAYQVDYAVDLGANDVQGL